MDEYDLAKQYFSNPEQLSYLIDTSRSELRQILFLQS